MSSTFQAEPRTGEVDEDLTHDARRDCEKVGAIVVSGASPVNEPQKGFMDERSGLQDPAGVLPGHVLPGKPMQLGINQRCQGFKRVAVALLPRAEELSNVVSRGCFHATPHFLTRRPQAADCSTGSDHTEAVAVWRAGFRLKAIRGCT